MKKLLLRSLGLIAALSFVGTFTQQAFAVGPHATGGNQYRADTGVAIAAAGTISTGVGVYFEANVTSDEGRTIRMEVELRSSKTGFTGAANYFSSYVSGGTRARTTTATGLAAGNWYWRYRVVDSAGVPSNWVLEGSPDFIVQSSSTVPTVQTVAATGTTTTSATINGTITSDGGLSIIDRRFDWGTTSGNLNQAVFAASITVSGNNFSAILTGLSPGTTYYFRAWARNGSTADVGYGAGWNIGSILSFTTSASCSYSISPSSASPGASSGSGSFGMTAGSGCSWSASTAYTWIHTTSSGSGNGTVSYTYDANTSTSSRSGTITAGGQTFTITQSGTSCSYSISPSSASPSASSGSGSFSITAGSGCSWSASTAYSWIHTTSSGSGNGTVNYTYDANTSTSSRSGTITTGGQTFTVTQAAAAGRAPGLDVSHARGTINWSSVAGDGRTFAIIKATDGYRSSQTLPMFTDPNFSTYMPAAIGAGLKVGAYHFARPYINSAKAEADFFVNVAGAYMGTGFLPPALDIEDPSDDPPSNQVTLMGKVALSQWIREFCAEIQLLKNVKPMLYMTPYFTRNLIDSDLAQYPLWIAYYPNTPDINPTSLGPWNGSWTFMQYAVTGTIVPGVQYPPVDLDVFNGDNTALTAYVSGGTGSDNTPPTLSAFGVSPSSIGLGQGFTISYTVSDGGGSHLKNATLWRANIDGTSTDPSWQAVGTATSLLGDGPFSGTFTDTPSAAGNYWYGLHVVDNATNRMDERTAGRGPIQATVQPTPTVMVTSPNGGENWQVGSSHNITATSIGSITGVQIDYSINGGSTWANLTGYSTVNNSISFNWTVLNTPSTTCKVRVTFTYSGGSVSDVSDANFTISQSPTLIVSSVTPSAVQTGDWGQSIIYTVTVKDGSGSPVSGATVGGDDDLKFVSYTTAPNTTDANGQITYTTTVPSGKANSTYNITFVAGKFGYNTSGTITRQVQVQHIPTSFGGIVTDSSSGNPISGAAVTWGSYNTTTSVNGSYAINNITCGNATLTVSRSGYQTLTQSYTPTCNVDSVKSISLRPGLSGTVRRSGGLDTTDYPVSIERYAAAPGIPGVINTTQRTWIVIHGRASSRSEPNISSLALAISAKYPLDQVLTLDWSSAASDGPFGTDLAGEDAIKNVGIWAATALQDVGFVGSKLNLVGHSWGSYVADELAERMSGGVNTIVGLDPAENVAGGYDPENSAEVNFALHSNYSWTFHSSCLGSTMSPTTADESFIVATGYGSGLPSAHSAVVDMFAEIINDPTGGNGINQLFTLERLLNHLSGPWISDTESTSFACEGTVGGYEGVISLAADHVTPEFIWYTPTTPEITVLGNGISIADGDSTPSSSDNTDFGSMMQGQTGPSRTFTVRNDGGSTLTLGSVSVPAVFTLDIGLLASLAPGASDYFTVRLDTTSAGTKSGQIIFSNNDGNENPFNFSVTGTVTTPPDTQGPVVVIAYPANNATVTVASLNVNGTASDSGRGNNGVSSVTVNGGNATGGTASGSGTASWNATITLNPGVNTVIVVAKDTLNNSTQQQINVTYNPPDTTPPTVSIGSPASGQTFTTSPITVSGTATDPGSPSTGVSLVQVQVNGTGGTWQTAGGTTSWNAAASLNSGANTIYVRSQDGAGNYSTFASVNVTYNPPETQGPSLTINFPANNATVTSASLNVSGTATDNGLGNNGVASVTVNGFSATGGTASGTGTANWNAPITLNPGVNTIIVVAKDTLNNPTQQQITVTYNPPTKIIVLSGNLAFGTVPTGTTSNRVLSIGNLGNSTMTVTNIAYPPGFSGSFSGTIPAGGSQNVTVTFSPTSVVNYDNTVKVNSDKTAGTDTINVYGTGTNNTAPGSFTPTGPLFTARDSQTATLLTNGLVLVAGGAGTNSNLSSAELYDPATGSWSPTGSLTNARAFHTATLLPNGKVLVAGGEVSNNSPVSSATLYNPATGTWTGTGSMGIARSSHTSTLLTNGLVLVTGGKIGGTATTNSAELYNPASGVWTPTSPMSVARVNHTATLLTNSNGKVLVAGGSTMASAELYDPASGNWVPAGNPSAVRGYHTATLLNNGKVLVAGGYGSGWVSSAELYDPVGGTWTNTGSLATARFGFTATLLPNGKVLAAGGDVSGVTSIAELFDPASGMWTTISPLIAARAYHTATLLPDGNVLIAGGDDANYAAIASAELYGFSSKTIRPWLNAGRLGGNMVFTWPTNAPGFTLEWTTNLPGTNWTPVSPGPSIIGGQFMVTNGMTGPSKFYRLKKP